MSQMNHSYCQLKGISGAGKGTRVAQLLMFLMDIYEHEYVIETVPVRKKVMIPDPDNEGEEIKTWSVTLVTMQLGIMFPKINTFFVGKFAKSNKSKLLSWTSADYLNSTAGFPWATDMIRERAQKMHVIWEGYPGMISANFRPTSLAKFGIKNVFQRSYTYDNKQQMLDRVTQRSSKPCKGDAAWRQTNAITSDFQAMSEELVIEDHNWNFGKAPFNQPLTHFGIDYLEWRGLRSELTAFQEYCRNHTVDRHYLEPQKNLDVFLARFEIQNDLLQKAREVA